MMIWRDVVTTCEGFLLIQASRRWEKAGDLQCLRVRFTKTDRANGKTFLSRILSHLARCLVRRSGSFKLRQDQQKVGILWPIVRDQLSFHGGLPGRYDFPNGFEGSVLVTKKAGTVQISRSAVEQVFVEGTTRVKRTDVSVKDPLGKLIIHLKMSRRLPQGTRVY
jgi:hypothetical protein